MIVFGIIAAIAFSLVIWGISGIVTIYRNGE